MNSIAHIEINVSNVDISKVFYTKILEPLGWKCIDVGDSSVVGFKAPDYSHLFLVQTERAFIASGFHRKRMGLNHVSFRVQLMEDVKRYSTFLDENSIEKIYHTGPKDYSSEYGVEHYYAVFFEDPDRIKLEVVFIK